MNCPTRRECADPEFCQQGGGCQHAVPANLGCDPDEQALLIAWKEYWEALTPEQRAAEEAAMNAYAYDHRDENGDLP